MIPRERCLEALEHAAAFIGETAATRPTAEVPRYPGNDLIGLVRHVVTIHEWVARIVADLVDTPPEQSPPDADLTQQQLLARYEASWRHLAATLAATDPEAPVWTFGEDRTVAFWLRRMAHETAMHAWDADSAVNAHPAPIPLDLAVTGLAEGLHIHCRRPLRKREIGGSGQTVGITCTDADADWTITLLPVGIGVEEGVGHPEARLAGTASDLWLVLGGRFPAQPVARFGNEDVLETLETALGTIRDAM